MYAYRFEFRFERHMQIFIHLHDEQTNRDVSSIVFTYLYNVTYNSTTKVRIRTRILVYTICFLLLLLCIFSRRVTTIWDIFIYDVVASAPFARLKMTMSTVAATVARYNKIALLFLYNMTVLFCSHKLSRDDRSSALFFIVHAVRKSLLLLFVVVACVSAFKSKYILSGD